MADSDPSLIVRLTPLNERTRSAWKDPHNTAFYVHPSFQGFEPREAPSREATPFSDDIDAQDKRADSESEIRLTLNRYPKELTQGYVFGKDKRFCDIYCGEWSRAFNISGQTFSIAVNKKGQVVLKYLTPKSVISVQYGNQEPGVRAKSTWILFRSCKNGIIVNVAERLEFRVIVPKHDTFGEDYKNACCEYVTNVESAVAAMPNLTMDSQPVTADPSRMQTPNTNRFYYRCKEREIGRGTYGKVYLVYDASTGEEYAGKEFHSDQVNYGEGQILAQQDHVSNVILSHTLLRVHLDIVQTNKVTETAYKSSVEEPLTISNRHTSLGGSTSPLKVGPY